MKAASVFLRLGIALFFLTSLPAHAVKIWTNSFSGLWQERTNWLEQSAPDSTSSVSITNDGTKTVLIGVTTPATNLVIQRLTLNAPPGATNTVLLSDVGVTNPLTIQTQLELQDGAALRVTNAALLLQLTNDHVNLDGTMIIDSGAIDFGDITVTARVGRVTSGILTVNGGLVSAGVITVGGLTNSSGAVYVNGGQLNVASMLSVGRNPGTTGLVWVAGGLLTVPNDDTKVGDSGVGQMIISNAAAIVTNMDVGHDSLALGTLWVQDGGILTLSNDLSLGVLAQATGAVWVAGGQISSPGQSIKIGRQGTGQFTVSNGTVQAANLLLCPELTPTNPASGLLSLSGGSLVLAGNVTVGTLSNSSGQATLTGGELDVTNSGATAVLSVPNGSLALLGGTLTVDNLFLTNASGQFVFGAGRLNTRATTAQNGTPFVVGDGVSPAVLHLNGGTHVFAGGLTIASNAMVTGCGTIIGTILNHGLLATNCASLTPPRITRLARAGATNTVYFTTVVGQSYSLQYKNHVNDAAWMTLPGWISGTGTILTLSDVSPAMGTRFYAVMTY